MDIKLGLFNCKLCDAERKLHLQYLTLSLTDIIDLIIIPIPTNSYTPHSASWSNN
jgi:hypothetical protein